MIENYNWEELINYILSYIDGDWNYLIVKNDLNRRSFTSKFYFSVDGKEYFDFFKVVDRDKMNTIFHELLDKFRYITEKLDNKEKILLTLKVKKTGEVKVIYRLIKNGDKLPFDKSINYIRLTDEDKIM